MHLTIRGPSLALCLAGALLAGCALAPRLALPPLAPEHEPVQRERLDNAGVVLGEMREIDVLARLDNRLLQTQIREGMTSLLAQTASLQPSSVDVHFYDQYIALDVAGVFTGEDGAAEDVVLRGDVALLFQSGSLVWQPRFHALSLAETPATSTPPSAEDASGETPESAAVDGPEQRLQRVDAEVTRVLLTTEVNRIELEPVPLGILEAGARLADGPGAVASEAMELDGVFTTAGVATLVEPAVTTLAFDLDFVPSVSSCAGDVEITRAAFAREIRNREPVGLSSLVNPDADVRHFFTEVSGARRPTTVIHYWFADGAAAAVVPLEVEPSARWRTWSSRPTDRPAARNWEVIVVEQSSGCILASMALVSEPDGAGAAAETEAGAAADAAPVERFSRAFENYRSDFLARAAPFPGVAGTPDVASIDVRREFFVEVLDAVLYDVRLTAPFRVGEDRIADYDAALEPIATEDVRCAGRECEARRVCTVDYDNCPLERDTRDCVSCLFRNPLNNRCMSEAQDPICEAARNARNDRLERERAACIESEQRARDNCERLRDQELESCRMQSESQLAACEAGRSELQRLGQRGLPMARVGARAAARGELSVLFSEFRVDGDLENLHMELGLFADLSIAGDMRFEPAEEVQQLAACIAGWSGEFAARATRSRWQTGLVAPLDVQPGALESSWSGFTHRLPMTPSPLQALYVEQPGILAACEIGLGLDAVARSLSGRDADFFRGEYELSIQPLPTRLLLLPAYLRYGDRAYSGDPRLESGFLSFRLSE